MGQPATAHWEPEIGNGKNIYATEIGKCYKSGLFTTPSQESHSLNIYQHTTAGTLRYVNSISEKEKKKKNSGKKKKIFK